jgi:hypothetical protein
LNWTFVNRFFCSMLNSIYYLSQMIMWRYVYLSEKNSILFSILHILHILLFIIIKFYVNVSFHIILLLCVVQNYFILFYPWFFFFLEINSLSWCNQGCTEFYTGVENSHTLRRSTPDYTKITSNIQHLRLMYHFISYYCCA